MNRIEQDYGLTILLYPEIRILINTVALARWLESEEQKENRFNGFRLKDYFNDSNRPQFG